MKQKLFLLIASISFFSCSQETLTDVADDTLSIDEVLATTQSLLIEKDAVSLTSQDAKNVAALFRSRNGGVSSRSASDLASESASVETIVDATTSEPLLYIVNWTNEGGFVVVSASKKCFPVACYSETGNFSIDADPASMSYLEDYKSLVQEAIDDTSDTMRLKYAVEWSTFEKQDEESAIASSRATSSAIQQMIEDEIAAKTALGYTYIGKITAAAYYLPESEYEALIEDVSSHTDSDYDYEEVSLFFVNYYVGTDIEPLMGTEWYQDKAPFNVGTSNGYAGCVPIAVGQIVNYHKYPEDEYDWDEMASVYADNEEIIKFMQKIRVLCQVEYYDTGTSSNYVKATSAFEELGYEVSLVEEPESSDISPSLKKGNPVYMRGVNSYGTGHAWVSEGYKQNVYEGVISMIPDDKYSLVTASTSTSLYQEYTFSLKNSSIYSDDYGDFFYMNFGWGGDNNGWYRHTTYNASDLEHSFNSDRKILIVEIP